MTAPADYLQIACVVEQSHVSFVRFLVMHDSRVRVRSSYGQVHTTPPASEVVAGQDIVTQGAPVLGVVQLAVFIGGCGALGNSKKLKLYIETRQIYLYRSV